jgi:N-acylneuraminate cytidylyltransferase/CMP-N,N'-diacetyllegionaminic acid synthase
LSKDIKVLWLVTARAGSKSIPDKNIKPLNGIPLLAHRIISALKSNYASDVWISTDSTEYAGIAQSFGAQVKFLRPEELAQDNSNSIEVVLHAMRFAEEHRCKFDFIGLLEPTSPFITENHLNEAVLQLVNTSEAHGIVSVKESRPNTIFIQDQEPYLETLAINLKNINKLGRQHFKKQITPSGGFYIAKWDLFLESRSFYTTKTLGYLVDDFAALEIDEPIDFHLAEFIVSRKQ